MTAQAARVSLAVMGVMRRSAAFQGSTRLRLGLPIVAVAVAVLAVDLFRAVFPAGGVFLVLLIPVIAVSLLLGTASGLLALALGVVGAVSVAAARAHPWLAEPADLLRVVPYLCIGGFVVLLSSVFRASVGRSEPEQPSAPVMLVEPLTPRETEVLGLAASGLSTDEIAVELWVSRNTVKSHLAHAYGKLGARNRAEAVAMGLHTGAIERGAVVARAEELSAAVSVEPA